MIWRSRVRTLRVWLILLTLPAGLWTCRSETRSAGERVVEVPESRLGSAAARERGRELYLRHCALCHGERGDGRGVRRNLSSRARDFTDPTWAQRTGPRQAFQAIREGVRGTAMPAWKILDDEQTWDLVAYLLALSESGR